MHGGDDHFHSVKIPDVEMMQVVLLMGFNMARGQIIELIPFV